MEQKRNKIQSLLLSEIQNFNLTYKEKDLERLMMLEASMRKYGQLRPIIVTRSEGVLFAVEGKKILSVAKVLGWESVDAIEIEDNTAESHVLLSIVLNELQFETNYIELSKHISVIEENRNLLPFTPIELDKLKSIADFDWNKLNKIDNPEQISLF